MIKHQQSFSEEEAVEGEIVDTTPARRGAGQSRSGYKRMASRRALGLFIVLISLPVVVLIGILVGLGVVADHILPLLHTAVVPFLVTTALLLALLTYFETTKYRALSLLYIGSFVYGVAAWLLGLFVTLQYWGVLAVILGLVLLGVGVIPLGLLAALVNMDWTALLDILALAVLAYGARRAVLRSLAMDRSRGRR